MEGGSLCVRCIRALALAEAAKARLHEQANPIAYRRSREIVRQYAGMEVAPTPERIAKGGIAVRPSAVAGTADSRPVYRSRGPVEQYADTWPCGVYNSFRAYIDDAHASVGPSPVIDMNRSGGGETRLGGLGNVHERTRDAYERYHWVRERLTDGAVQVLDWLVLEVKREATGQGMSLTDVGARIFPSIRDKATSKGIAIGRLQGAGEELAKLYRRFAVLSADEDRQRRTMRVIRGEPR